MSTTKTLPPGIPIADAQGSVSALSVAELAKQVGGCAAATNHSSGDFNDFTDPGFHTITGSVSSFQNAPTSESISRSILLVTPTVANTLVQIYFNPFKNLMKMRSMYDGEWCDWKEISAGISGGGKRLPIRVLQTLRRQERRAAA